MKKQYQIYYKMTSEMQEATDHIEDKLSECREKNGNEDIVKVILKSLDEWKPSLVPSERKIILDYFKEEYKLNI